MEQRIGNPAPVRNAALDWLKAFAVLFVVILLLTGYTEQLKGLDSYSPVARIIYYALQAIAYPAIHLFVLIGSWFMLEKPKPIKAFSRVYAQTWTVTVLGLALAAILVASELTVKRVLICVLPLTQRAYWFVSDYLILILLAPFLNKIVAAVGRREICILVAILFSVLCILPMLSITEWEASNLLLFVLLYFLAAAVRKHETAVQNREGCWLLLWVLAVLLLCGSAVGADLLSGRFAFLAGKELFFYRYASPLVVLAGLFLFCNAVSRGGRQRRGTPLPIRWICSASLLVYLLHMHPIWKELYTSSGLLGFVETGSALYGGWILALALGVVLGGTLIGALLLRPVSEFLAGLLQRVLQRVFRRRQNNT